MNFIKQIERIKMINQLIKLKNTGSPDKFALKLGISRKQLYNTIELLKDYDVERFYGDQRLLQIGEGTLEIQRLVISRYLLWE